MPTYTIVDAQQHLDDLIDKALAGEDVLIISAASGRVQVVPLSPEEQKATIAGLVEK